MTLVAMACVIWPLTRRRAPEEAPGAPGTNLAILRDHLAELQDDLERGAISPGQFEVARAELDRRALEETSEQTPRGKSGSGGARRTAIVLGALIPLAVSSMYIVIGDPGGLSPQAGAGAPQASAADVEDMVARLAERLQKNPDDAKGWALLGRSYYVMQRMDEAVAAYANAVAKIDNDADLYADYADAMAMSQGRNLRGKPMELVNRALAINPSQPKALAMAGTEAFYRKDYPAAIALWEKLLQILPADSELTKSIVDGLAEARELGGTKSAQKATVPEKTVAKPMQKAAPQGSVSGQVTLSPVLASKTNATDTLFVLARAVSGPRIPLAVLRRQVSDLPLEFTLDDTLAMSQDLKLSGVSEVIVSARISKSGNAISQAGDLQGASAPVKVGAKGLKIVIDSVVP